MDWLHVVYTLHGQAEGVDIAGHKGKIVMKVTIEGQSINLGKHNFMAQGGEGEVYAHGAQAVKIYKDAKKMIPVGKIAELDKISHQRIIKPLSVVYKRNKPVGYTMSLVKNTYVLCQLFTRAFKDREGVTPDIAIKLVHNIRESVSAIHSANVLVVDMNEMNLLVSQSFTDAFFIDVDSYQTKSYPATALMESIRDRLAPKNKFSQDTDWFAFAIITFQLMVGIHPYKGKHSHLRGLDARMGANMSVFNPDVRMPRSAYSFDIIPEAYRLWYKAVFETGHRGAPPIGFQNAGVITIVAKTTRSGKLVAIEELFDAPDPIIGYVSYGQHGCLVLSDGVILDKKTEIKREKPDAIIYYGSTPFAVYRRADHLELYNLKHRKKTKVANGIVPEKIMAYDNRLYIKHNGFVSEMIFMGSEASPIVSSVVVANVMPHATWVYLGVVIQDILGVYNASVFTESRHCTQISLPELAGYKIVDAQFTLGVLVIIGTKHGKYDRFVFDTSGRHVITEDVSYAGINFVVLDNGLVVLMNEDECLEVFARGKISKVKVIKDPILHGGMRLYTNGGTVMFTDGSKLFSMRMKK